MRDLNSRFRVCNPAHSRSDNRATSNRIGLPYFNASLYWIAISLQLISNNQYKVKILCMLLLTKTNEDGGWRRYAATWWFRTGPLK